MKKLIIHAAIQIRRPVDVVFDSIIDPQKMTQYFISDSTGRLEEGKRVFWKWPEFPEYPCPVDHIKIDPYRSVSFIWGNDTMVRIDLEEQIDKSVVVRVAEGEKEPDEAGLKWYGDNTEGWANFLASMKAFLEYGINLRSGAFDFMRK